MSKQLSIEPLHRDLGARITGIALSDKLPSSTLQAIQAAIDEYSVLCFPNQSMTDETHLGLTQGLGTAEPNHVKLGATGEVDYLATIGNVIDAHTKKGNDDPHTRYQQGNNLWHSDASFQKIPAKFTINCAYEVPDVGGETEYVSQRVAYERLSEAQRKSIDPLSVLHDYVFSRSQVAPVDPNHAAALPPVVHALVQCNPANGRKNYFVGAHARSIVDWSGIDGRRLIDELLEHATGDECVYRHRWSVGDVVIWDNRCILHRGVGFDADRWRRRLRQTRVAGDQQSP